MLSVKLLFLGIILNGLLFCMIIYKNPFKLNARKKYYIYIINVNFCYKKIEDSRGYSYLKTK